jgi:hypothetical protein
MRSRANTVMFQEATRATKVLPEVGESRQELIEAVMKTEIYGRKKLLAAKNPLSEQLHTLVSFAKDRSQLYGKDVDTTANNLIKHMGLLESIGNTLNPTSGLYTARGDQRLKSDASNNIPPTFSPEDHTVLIKFLTSEAKLCAREIDKVEQAIDASEKSFANFALHKAGMTGIERKIQTFNGEQPQVYLKMEYHKVQEDAYTRAAHDYHQSARLYSEAQLYDSAIKGHTNQHDFQSDLHQRTDSAIHNEKNDAITMLTDNNSTNTRKDVKAEIEILVEGIHTEEKRTIADKGSKLLSGKAYREVSGLDTSKVNKARAKVKRSDLKISNINDNQTVLRKQTTENLVKIETLRSDIVKSATKFVDEKDDAVMKYKSLMTQSNYYEDSADKTMARAAKEVENHYEDKGYNLNSNKDLMRSEDTNLRTKLTKFKELKATVTDFQDNLSAFVSSVAPMKTTRERSSSVSISKKPSANAEAQSPAIVKITRERSVSMNISNTPSASPAAQNPAIAGLLRAREANQAKANPKKEKEQTLAVEPRRSCPK